MMMIGAALAVLVSGFASAAAEPQRWEGKVELPGLPLEFSVALEESSGVITIPAQGVKDMALSDVSVGSDRIVFTIAVPGAPAQAHAKFEFTVDGVAAKGTLKQSGMEFAATMTKLAAGETPKGPDRPQEPKPPFPYTVTDVVFKVEHGRAIGHSLSGTLTVPEGKGPHPAVVLVSGSGPQDRDESLMGHKPFLVLADALTRRGIVVLRYDDRGVARSTGDFRVATTDDFTDDAAAAVAYLKTRAEVDAAKIGMIGHSEGGLVAPMAAVRRDASGLSFIVLLAGPGQPSVELLTLQGKLLAMASGTPQADADRISAASEKVLASVRDGKTDDEVRAVLRALIDDEVRRSFVAATEDEVRERVDQGVEQQFAALSSPWMKRFLAIDPAEYLAKVKVPVLAINGEKDLQVPAKENLALIEKHLAAAGNTHVETRVLKGLNHLFQTCTTGAVAEYAAIRETMSPEALDLIATWIRKETGLEKAGEAPEKKAEPTPSEPVGVPATSR